MSRFRETFSPEIKRVERRALLRGGLSLGALTLLSGCGDLSGDDDLIDRALWAMLRFNDRVQAALFNPNRLAATFTRADITTPFKFNAYYPESQIRTVDPGSWKLEVGGVVDRTTHPGPCSACAPCRRKARSHATSASKAGARSASGAARRSTFS